MEPPEIAGKSGRRGNMGGGAADSVDETPPPTEDHHKAMDNLKNILQGIQK